MGLSAYRTPRATPVFKPPSLSGRYNFFLSLNRRYQTFPIPDKRGNAHMTVTAAIGRVPGPLADSQSQTSVAIFKQSWSTYQKLLETDFLEHRTLYAALRELLLREWGAAPSSPPLAWLDLGCGDAEQAAAALHACGAPAGALALASYTGVDVSAPALAGAAVNLAFLQPKCSVSLVEQDMKDWVVASPDHSYDIIFSSFAVHHLSREGKAAFVAQVARCLRPGGLFVLVDVFLRDGESREQYMQRYNANMADAVAQGIIQPQEARTVMQHIEGFDFPEEVPEYERMAAAAGFSACQCLATDSKEFGRLLVLRK